MNLTLEDDTLLARQEKSQLEELGNIRLVVHRIIAGRLGHDPVGHDPVRDQDHGDIGPVHERSKKAGVHCVKCVNLFCLCAVPVNLSLDLEKSGGRNQCSGQGHVLMSGNPCAFSCSSTGLKVGQCFVSTLRV